MPRSISGDIIQKTDMAFLFAIEGDPDDTIWIPTSVVEDGDVEVDDDVDLLITTWFYDEHAGRFD